MLAPATEEDNYRTTRLK